MCVCVVWVEKERRPPSGGMNAVCVCPTPLPGLSFSSLSGHMPSSFLCPEVFGNLVPPAWCSNTPAYVPLACTVACAGPLPFFTPSQPDPHTLPPPLPSPPFPSPRPATPPRQRQRRTAPSTASLPMAPAPSPLRRPSRSSSSSSREQSPPSCSAGPSAPRPPTRSDAKPN